MPFGYSQFAIDCLSLMHVDQRLGHCVLSGQIKVAVVIEHHDTTLSGMHDKHEQQPAPANANHDVPHSEIPNDIIIIIIIIILFTYRNLQVSCSFYYLQQLRCLVYLYL